MTRYAKTTIKIRCYPQSFAIYNDGVRLSSDMLKKIFDPYVKKVNKENPDLDWLSFIQLQIYMIIT